MDFNLTTQINLGIKAYYDIKSMKQHQTDTVAGIIIDHV